MAIDWGRYAAELEYETEKEMWEKLYKRFSVNQLAKRFSVSAHAVRIQLATHGVQMRGRGGPNNQKIDSSKLTQEEIDTKGIAQIAAEMGVHPTSLYKHLFYSKGKLKRPVPSSVPAVPQTEESSGDPDHEKNR